MFKIGDFSKLSHVTVKTLRYYDDVGLIRPARVDDFTGYRYYSADQLPRLNRILALKDLGFTLDEIAGLLDSNLPSSELKGMFLLKQAEIQRQVNKTQEQLARVQARLRQIELEDTMTDYDVIIKKVEPQTIASIREVVPHYRNIGDLFGRICGGLIANGIKPNAPGMSIYYDSEYKETDVDVEAALPIPASIDLGNGITVRELPGVESMACVIHHGPYGTLDQAYGALLKWIEDNCYMIIAPIREIYLQHMEHGTASEADCITEIQVPVAKQ